MTRDRDIERVLDHWFADGPSVIPDRVMVHALQRVDRTPQRRLAALLARYRPMSASLRLGLAAAAVVAVVVAGMTVFRPAPGPGATPSPSPTAAPSASTPIPAALVDQWMGSPRNVDGINPVSGTSMRFNGSGFVFTASNKNDIAFLTSLASSLGDDRFELRSTSATTGCGLDEDGTYTWSLSPGGRVLTIAAESDACAVRGGAVPGTWWKMDCPTPDDPCLGDLEAGTYASQFIDPFVAADGNWVARHGALSYTVPEGWTNTADWPAEFKLAQQGVTPAGIYLWSDVVIVSEEDPCLEEPAAGVGRTAGEITDWLASAPGLIATTPEPVSIGGLDGFRLDLDLDDAWTNTCPFSAGFPARPIFTDTQAGSGFHWGLGPDTIMRLFVLDLGDGRAVVIDIEAETRATFLPFAEEAAGVVASFQFSR